MTAEFAEHLEAVGLYLDEIIDKEERSRIPLDSEQPQLDQNVCEVFKNVDLDPGIRIGPSEMYYEQAHRNLVISIHEPLKKKHQKHRRAKRRRATKAVRENKKIVKSSELTKWQANMIRKTDDLSAFIYIESASDSELEDEKDRIAQLQHRTEHAAAAHHNVLGHRQRKLSRSVCEREKPATVKYIITNESPESVDSILQDDMAEPKYVVEDIKLMTEAHEVPIDYQPHEMFIELEELHVDDITHKIEWVETARWMKYEEDVEESKRWGKPHVASLSFHSLLDFRKGLAKGIMMFNLDKCTLYEIASSAVEEFVKSGLLADSYKDLVMNALLLKHRHQFQRSGSIHGSMEHLFTKAEKCDKLSSPPQTTTSSLGTVSCEIGSVDLTCNEVSDTKKRDGEESGAEKCQIHQDQSGFFEKTRRRVSSWTAASPPVPKEDDLPHHTKQNVTFQDSEIDIASLTGSESKDNDEIMSSCLTKETSNISLVKRRASTISIMIDDKPPEQGVCKSLKASVSIDGPMRRRGSMKLKKMNRLMSSKTGCEAAPVLVGKLQFLENTLIGMIRLAHAQVLDEVMELPIPVRFLFILLGPDNDEVDYHEMGRCISTLMSNKEFQEKMYKAESNEEVLKAINMFLDDSVVLPPGEYGADQILPDRLQIALKKKRKQQKQLDEDSRVRMPMIKGRPNVTYDPLDKSGQCLGGITRDLIHLKDRYCSDLRDGLNWASLESVILMLCLVLAPAVTFGGFMGRQTDGKLGVLEMVLSTCIGGTLFGLVSGQPLIIVGSTGPIYVFEEHLYHFCHIYHIPFLEYRAWIGVWISLIFLIFSCLELGYLIRFFTRFTEEIVGVMVSLIFLYESISAITEIFHENSLTSSYNTTCNMSLHPLNNNTSCPNTALFSLLLMIGTFIIGLLLRRMRHSFYLRKRIRSIMSGFGLTIAMFIMICIAHMTNEVYLEPLDVPDVFRPTYKNRGWFISLYQSEMDPWMPIHAIIPAILVSVLIFMETHLCGLFVNRDANRLVKGSCPNLDMICMGVILLMCSLFGLPWLCADPVRTVAHIRTLTVYSKHHAPGEKPRLLFIHEQRITNIAVHLLCGLLLVNPVILQSVPLAVLLGVFLFLGIISLSSLQFTRRFKMLFMSSKHFPDYCFTRKVKTLKIHLYTAVQIVLSAVLIGIKLSPISPIFPLCVTSLAVLRKYGLSKLFSTQDLHELDREEDDGEEDDSDIDEYGEGIMG